MSSKDLDLLEWLNSYVGHSDAFDRALTFWTFQDLLKGGFFVFLLVLVWFARHPRQRKRRLNLASGLIGICIALGINRALGYLLEHRVRPLQADDLGFALRRAKTLSADAFYTVNSFPSDHAVLFLGLGLLLFVTNWPVGLVALAYALVCILAPRVALGLHYPSDILAGGVLGMAMVAIFLSAPAKRYIGMPIVSWQEKHPGLFYPLAFFLAWQMATLFQEAIRWVEFLVSSY